MKHKTAKILTILTLTCLISIPLLTPLAVSAQESEQNPDNIEKTFNWDYAGHHWKWNLTIPTELYETYKSVPISTRTRDGPSGYGYLTTTKDYYIQMLATKLNETTTELGYGAYDQVSFALAFVQSLPYTSDNVTEGYNEYPRFPIETLVDDGGDCEDTSILFASITLAMGYGTVYINPPNHYAVGILGSNIKGTSWEYPEGSNRTYFYCETTGDGFKIGQLPMEFIGQSAYIYAIDEGNQYVPEILVTATEAPTPTKSAIIGSATPTPTPNMGSDDITSQTPMPLSFNLAQNNPVATVLVIFAVIGSFALTLWSVRRHHLPLSEVKAQASEENKKFCIYCGVQNKGAASYCEKCGKEIGS